MPIDTFQNRRSARPPGAGRRIANILSIAGTDPTGGAGIQADLKSFAAHGAHGMAVITAVVAQNTIGVRSFVSLTPDFIAEQIDAVFDDVRVDAVKIGMVPTAEIAGVVAERLSAHGARNIVLDPVMVAKSGDRLLRPDAVATIRERLLPLATLVTPNLPEAGVLLESRAPTSLNEMRACLAGFARLGGGSVLLKGGHLAGSESIDMLCHRGELSEFRAPRLATRNLHGAGCTLAAAIAALLPALPLEAAVGRAKGYLTAALRASDELSVGHGHGPVHHFHALWQQS